MHIAVAGKLNKSNYLKRMENIPMRLVLGQQQQQQRKPQLLLKNSKSLRIYLASNMIASNSIIHMSIHQFLNECAYISAQHGTEPQ